MQHLAIAAAATAVFIGAGSGAVTSMTGAPPAMPMMDVSNPMIAGTAMLPGESILANASKSPEHAKFVSEVKAAGLASTLDGAGTYTVFAPTDAAYGELGKDKAAAILKSAKKNARYLVVKGSYDSTKLLQLINEQGGRVKLHTLEGGTIVASLNGPTNILLMDENGAMADIAVYDIHQKNGVMQVIDRVLTPGKETREVAGR
ncbi:MAG: fasciclin domain-containing protein [Proteobacteria bacterium]|nr:fasciclin domain-containing protein [Pseudomonadota bacterium]